MPSIERVERILQELPSREIKDYINSLSEEDYCALSTAYKIGRSGWDRTFYSETPECISFIEESENNGIRVDDKILDDKFLTNDLKKELVELEHNHTLSSVTKENGIYMHNWLDGKGQNNLINYGNKGLNMLKEIR